METLLHNLIQATGWSILHSLWQSALIYALLLPFQLKVFRLNAKLKYILAYSSICLMFVSFVFTFTLAFQWPSENVSRNMATHAIALPAAMPLNLAHYIETLFPYVVFCYGLGLIVQSVIVIQGYKKVQLLKNAAYTMIPQEWKTFFDGLTKELNIKKHIDFRLSDHVNVPLVIGFFKPVILFPIALAAQMDLKQVETILIHELSHIRRNDYVFNLIRTMIDIILFFNPFVWLAGRFINIEREHACDDLVVKVTDTPLTYAHALLTLELITEKSSPALALAATGATNQYLYQRIKRITDMKTNYANSKQKLFAITLTIATIISLAWINPAKEEKTSKHIGPDLSSKNGSAVMLTEELCPIDTGKKKKRKAIKIVNTDSVRIKAPNAPEATENIAAAPKTPPAPPAPKTPAVAPLPPIAPVAPDLNIDTAPITAGLSDMVINFSADVKDMAMAHFNGENAEEVKKMQAELQRKGMELQRKFNSPEEKAKWQKIAAEMKAKYDNPKERAKWEKIAKEAEAKANSPEQKAMIKRIQIQAKIQAEQAQKIVSDPEFRKNIQQIAITQQQPFKIMIENENTQKVKQTPEYIELKKKFDKDVEDLANKNTKKEN
ncbi:M56 family metallopeptidase [Pedobacter hartonius]|uniref:Signal transducer regulating beta-lactamase production, contains metallopeptidase domain n=1 Tax=Pedobacter hartonius TaxID=425514 RepID=A0A1H4GV82_9SPHI|nr:M56 family metallopeptidase [Pedobacter hartonius]SEB13454.1 Signal transducer regulating beta-lactamase production, contains metallopeptidase domain [Pedobacter hartonius]